MNVEYTAETVEISRRGLNEIYESAERSINGGMIGWSYGREELMNAFQVFRYAMREWALKHREGTVLRMLMLNEDAIREVECRTKKRMSVERCEEVGILCDDERAAKAIETVLKDFGYVEE